MAAAFTHKTEDEMSATAFQRRRREEAAKKLAAQQVTVTKVNFKKMKVDQLRQLAEAGNVEGFEKMTKKQLIEALEADDS